MDNRVQSNRSTRSNAPTQNSAVRSNLNHQAQLNSSINVDAGPSSRSTSANHNTNDAAQKDIATNSGQNLGHSIAVNQPEALATRTSNIVLSNGQAGARNVITSEQRDDRATCSMQDLESMITDIVSRIVSCRVGETLPSTLTIRQNAGRDARSRYQDLAELDKIPDVVKGLREFSGEAIEFTSWKKSVERILSLYDSLQGTTKYFGILSVVRNKIIGNADAVLESYNTPLEWNAISRCLTLHYADKRDLSTLEYEMALLRQGNMSVQEFYQSVYTYLSLILSNVACLDIGAEALSILSKTYRDKALDTFIRGLKGDLSRLLAIREPSDLPQALHLCKKLESQTDRTTLLTQKTPFNKFHAGNPQRLQGAYVPRDSWHSARVFPQGSNRQTEQNPIHSRFRAQAQQNVQPENPSQNTRPYQSNKVPNKSSYQFKRSSYPQGNYYVNSGAPVEIECPEDDAIRIEVKSPDDLDASKCPFTEEPNVSSDDFSDIHFLE